MTTELVLLYFNEDGYRSYNWFEGIDDVYDFIDRYSHIQPLYIFDFYYVRQLSEDNGYLAWQELADVKTDCNNFLLLFTLNNNREYSWFDSIEAINDFLDNNRNVELKSAFYTGNIYACKVWEY